MLDPAAILPGMTVVDASGKTVGVVKGTDDRRIRLSGNHSHDGLDHFLMLDGIDRVEGDRVHLRKEAQIPAGAR